MTVEVTENGVIMIEETGDLGIVREGTSVAFTFTFDNREAAARYYNAVRASIEVGCIHIHMNAKHEPEHLRH